MLRVRELDEKRPAHDHAVLALPRRIPPLVVWPVAR